MFDYQVCFGGMRLAHAPVLVLSGLAPSNTKVLTVRVGKTPPLSFN